MKGQLTSLQFYSRLTWLDCRPLLDTIEPYRRALFTAALDTYEGGRPKHNMVLVGRAKKNNKTTDLGLGALYCVVARRRAPQGNDAIILASDEDQAGDDLDLIRKLIVCNPPLRSEFDLTQKEFRLKDGTGLIRILSARDVAGAHGKQYSFIGFDEIHTHRSWDILEALQPDPTRRDALQWITSYDTIYNTPGVPLHDLKRMGMAGSDPRMLFSWYSGDLCTDPAFADLPPEQRANPSMASWPEGAKYLEQQKRRLPTHKYRRLHLNLPGAPEGAFFDQGKVLSAIVPGRHKLPYQPGRHYLAFNDISGGSKDDATLCLGHVEGRVVVQDLLEKQAGGTPFNPRDAIHKFAGLLREYHCHTVWGDLYAGQTFPNDYLTYGITYRSPVPPVSEQYELLEPVLNAGEVELLDHGRQQEQLLTLVMRGAKVTHERNAHDDHSNALAGMVWLARRSASSAWMSKENLRRVIARAAAMPRYERNLDPDRQPFTPGSIGELRFLRAQRAQRRW